MPDFENYLESIGKPPSGLTTANFTFFREPLNLRGNKEIIKTAKSGYFKKVSMLSKILMNICIDDFIFIAITIFFAETLFEE